ncbi:MAG: Hsp70 family protein [Bryobacterales bacterium]|nr:Hsp70 family protein [Bryobacterales bacterium]
MKLGIDFGTTRIVVAASDRGNYPVVSFETPDGASEEWFPPLVALRGGERLFGWDAYARQADPEWTVIRSLKRLLEDAGPNTSLEIAGQTVPLLDLLRGLIGSLKEALRASSTLPGLDTQSLEVMLGVPAHANTNQRFLTAEAFRQSGFDVLGILNEPSAASIEYGHRTKTEIRATQSMLVYDLGGGTFDVSLVEYDDKTQSVIATEGIGALGGDDFDHLLADLALETAGLTMDSLTTSELFRLLEECRHKKEALHPQTRKMVIDLDLVREGLAPVSVSVPTFYERSRPYVEETLHAVRDMLEKSSTGSIDSLYVTGGGSELPLVSRMLREEFGRRVKRSAHTRSATAIGLAIQADASSGYELRERFTRYFGVWREADSGNRIIFDPLFPKGAPLPAPGEASLEITRAYHPVHNIGHFRYLECSQLTQDCQPAGDITIWDEILFPFDPALHHAPSLTNLPVSFCQDATSQVIEEHYRCEPGGFVVVSIRNRTAGYERSWSLGRWAVKTKPLPPVRKRRGASA